jgi:hypothetical protein
MTPPPAVAPRVLLPRDCARALGTDVPALVSLLKQYRYPFTELVPGGKPGQRGGRRWGLTPAQLDAVVRAQERQFEPPPEGDEQAAGGSSLPPGHQRLVRKKKRVAG